ncbi:MAG: hypothetical protein ACRDU5_18730 [Mycobacterium sp.]
MVAGPGFVGTAVASADLLGVGPDILVLGDDDNNKKSRPAAREPDLPEVSTEPMTRSVVIRKAPAAPAERAVPAALGAPMAPTAPIAPRAPMVPRAPAQPAPAAPAAPVIVPPAIVPPPAPVVVPPAGRPQPPSSPIPVTREPRANNPLAPPASVGPSPMPDSFRVGYPEYLRAATVSDLVLIAAPGVAGLMAFAAAGGVVGYRQARNAQAAVLPRPVATRFLQ